MTQFQAPRFRIALALCLFTAGPAAIASGQTTGVPKSGAAPNGVTGTDPCPKNYVCTIQGPTPQAKLAGQGAPSATGNVVQVVLQLFGIG